jgi:gamma-glutamylcyclotransferase (GGCT)/AIG2-like uncharacterized protein YtfP
MKDDTVNSDRRLPVFVYGTLRPGEKNFSRYLQGSSLRQAPATIAGELFYVADGGYPYLLPGPGRVQGELIDIDPSSYSEVLRRLDALEEYDPANEAGSVYLRRPAAVRLEDGTIAEAWVYYWNCPDIGGEKIVSGDFRRQERGGTGEDDDDS